MPNHCLKIFIAEISPYTFTPHLIWLKLLSHISKGQSYHLIMYDITNMEEMPTYYNEGNTMDTVLSTQIL